jgi:hypothetical protein
MRNLHASRLFALVSCDKSLIQIKENWGDGEGRGAGRGGAA